MKQVHYLVLAFLLLSTFVYFSSKNTISNYNRALLQDPNNAFTSTESLQPLVTNKNKNVLIYNRIPKTGSTTFANVCNKLSVKNKFWTVNLNGSLPSGQYVNCYVWPPSEQRKFLHNITTWTNRQPAIYHGHFAFIQPNKFLIQNSPAISYINLIRNPLSRIVSYYYFIRYGDDFRPKKERSKHLDHTSFDDCVATTYNNPNQIIRHQDCGPEKIWIQIPFFCGQHKRCWHEDSRKWAFDMAVENFYKYYSLVGYVDRYFEYFEMLEDLFPEFFENVVGYIKDDWGGLEKLSLRHTRKKVAPSAKSIEILENTLEFKYEMEFYKIIKQEFDEMYANTYKNHKLLRSCSVNYNKPVNGDGKFKGQFRP